MHPYHHPLFNHFIVYFNRNQDYFECHEVLEEYWKSIPGAGKRHPLTAFILLATGLYHWRRKNLNGAIRTLVKAEKQFSEFQPLYRQEIDYEQLVRDLKTAIQSVESNKPFSPFQIGFQSDSLFASVQKAADQLELLPPGSDAIIHKHMLRDRTDILRSRQKKKRSRD
ncbi:putative metal-dependent hydrolase [Sporosarcina luteola]|nr:putative metal-dependent hydrolase [Sporosarcina luteola]